MVDYVFKPSDVLTFDTVQANNCRLQKVLNQRADVHSIRVDLSEVTRCDSTGLALLIEIKRLCNQKNMAFAMDHMSESLSGLAEFCGVDSVLL